MARAPRPPASTPPQAANGKSERERIVDAFMGLLGEQPIERIGFAEIAARAGVSLAELRTWLKDEDPGLARTLSALDRALARGQRAAGLLDDLCRIPACICRARPRRRRDAEEDTIAA